MNCSLALVFSLVVSTPPVQPAATTLLGELAAREARGALDEGTAHYYRVAAFRRPDLLPADLRALAVSPDQEPHGSATAVFQEAWRYLQTRGRDDAALHALLQPPDDYAFTLDSTVWPLRVNYASSGYATKAQQILDAAETSYSRQIEDWGWYQPTTFGNERYRFYIDDAQGAAAYTAPFEENPDTAWTDCFTYIVVDPMNGEWEIPSVMAHEINHSMQAAMDCLEITAFWENTATYMMAEVFPNAWYYAIYTVPDFQSQPWRSLHAMSQGGDAYEYGGALLLWYLTDRFAPTDGAIFAREVWETAIQNGHSNEPDYFDAIGTVIAEREAGATFDGMFMDFSEARYFVASNDDGNQIGRASCRERV